MDKASTIIPMPNQKNFLKPEFISAIFAIVLGLAYCIAVPYGAGFDEETHMLRIYDISGYHFIPNQSPPFHKNTTTLAEFHDLSFQRRFLHNSAADMFTREALSQKFSLIRQKSPL